MSIQKIHIDGYEYPYINIERHAQLCPICNGRGKYKNDVCHGCYGKGWIII